MRRIVSRSVLKTAHRWIGLAVGLVLVLLGLTGSLLVFQREIDHFVLNHDLWRVESRARSLTLAELAVRLKTQRPGGQGYAADRPAFEGSAPSGSYEAIDAKGPPRFMVAALDPASGRVRGEYEWGALPPDRRNLMTVVYRLHYELLAGSIGLTSVGIIGLLAVLLVGLGLYLWWPRPGRWRQALSIKRRAPVVRRQFDLHGISGATGGVALGIVALSGAYMALPDSFRIVIGSFASITPFPEAPVVVPSARKVSPATVEAAARRTLENARYDSFALADAGKAHRLTFREPGDVRMDYGSTVVFVDPNNGVSLSRQSPATMSTADLVLRFQFPLHNGQAMGLGGRLVVAVLGLLPAALFITGTRLWWLRHSARRRGRSRSISAEARRPDNAARGIHGAASGDAFAGNRP